MGRHQKPRGVRLIAKRIEGCCVDPSNALDGLAGLQVESVDAVVGGTRHNLKPHVVDRLCRVVRRKARHQVIERHFGHALCDNSFKVPCGLNGLPEARLPPSTAAICLGDALI